MDRPLFREMYRKTGILQNTLNGDSTERAKIVPTANSGFVTGKPAAGLLARRSQSKDIVPGKE